MIGPKGVEKAFSMRKSAGPVIRRSREPIIAVLPSRREGLPKSLLEAAACGRPIIATDVPGGRAIARAGVNALLVPADDAAALADAIDRLAQDAELRRRFGAASRRLAEDEFSSQRIGRETVALYDRLPAASAHCMTSWRDPNDGLTAHCFLS